MAAYGSNGMEVVFGNSLGRPRQIESEDDYEALIRAKINDAVDYERSYLQWARIENTEYYNGTLPAIETEDDDGNPVNRSTVVSTDVRDTILSVLPSLIRIFLSSEYSAFFTPMGPDQTEMAKQATEAIHYAFKEECEGFLLLYNVFKDALTVKLGVAQVWTDTSVEYTEKVYHNVSTEQYQVLMEERDDIEVTDLQTNPRRPGVIESLSLRFPISKPKMCVDPVKPEEFRISRYATSSKRPGLIGWQRMVSVSDMLKRGYDYDTIAEYISNDVPSFSDERFLRNPGLNDQWSEADGVLYGEYFIEIDGDGDGIDELRMICTIGENDEIINDIPVDDHNFSLFSGDPRPHTIIGDCLADLTKDIQRIKSNMLRGQLDNLAEVINPKTVINALVTNVEDALNDEVGAVIRVTGDPGAAVSFSRPPYVGEEVQGSIAYMDEIKANRTGITEASKGLDPAAMQSTALAGIDAIISGAQERIELIARVLAETGFKRLFKLMLKEFVNNPNPEYTYQLGSSFQTVQPSTWDPNMRCRVNPSLGRGTDATRIQVLSMVKDIQENIIAKYGLDNPVVGIPEYYNTLEDMLQIANIRDVGRYFKKPDPKTLEAIARAPKEPDAPTILAMAEREKVKLKTVEAINKKNLEEKRLETHLAEVASDDDFRRDKLNVDSLLKAAEISKDIISQEEEAATLAANNTRDVAA